AETQSNGGAVRDQGPGWLPAIMAGTVLLGIFGFIFCAFSTWVLFQKRTELAIRTLKGAYVTDLEQSLLEPKAKQRVLKEIESLIAAMEGGKYEDWQSAAIMQRLQRLPVLQWGELQAVQAFIAKSGDDNSTEQLKQLSRLERAVEDGKVTSFDFQDVLESVHRSDPGSTTGFQLIQPLTSEAVAEVVLRAKLVADRAKVPDQEFPDVDLGQIVQKEIEVAAKSGGF
ncbi:MAG: hypothetical protein ACR2NZ_11250, partial [Rubripirellula sp.]